MRRLAAAFVVFVKPAAAADEGRADARRANFAPVPKFAAAHLRRARTHRRARAHRLLQNLVRALNKNIN